MPLQGKNAEGITPFEQRLTRLRPNRSIDSEQLMFAAGQAETATRMRDSQLRWKAVAGCSTAIAFMLSMSLATALHTTSQLRQSEIARQSQLDTSPPEHDIESWHDLKLADNQPSNTSKAPSPFLTIRNTRLAAATEIASLPKQSRGTGGSSFSYGDFRRMSVVTDEFDERLRRLESLRP